MVCNSISYIMCIILYVPQNSQFHKQFNKRTIKVSYSCMTNMANIISGHNKKVTDSSTEDGCNCRDGTDSCVLSGKRLDKNPKNTLD